MSSLDFDLDFVNPEEEEGLDENREGKGVNQPHSGDKLSKCNQYDYTMYTSSHAGNLRIHLITHSGEKSHKCNQCDYASCRASDLKKHLKIHSGEKSNTCNKCDYAYSQGGHLM